MRVLVIAIALAIASSATASPFVRQAAKSAPPASHFSQARIQCLDAGLGGSCPSPLIACKAQCDEDFDYDNLRCMASAGGMAPVLRAICHGKAFAFYSQCLKDCSDVYG